MALKVRFIPILISIASIAKNLDGVNPAERRRENPARVLAKAEYSQHLEIWVNIASGSTLKDVEFPSERSCSSHFRAISEQVRKLQFNIMSFNTLLQKVSLPGAKELNCPDKYILGDTNESYWR